MPSADKLNLVDHWNFQQDNDPKHTSKSTQLWWRKTEMFVRRHQSLKKLYKVLKLGAE